MKNTHKLSPFLKIEYQKAGIGFMFTVLLQNLVKRYSAWRQKRIWVKNGLLKREEVEELRYQDSENYRNYLQMNTDAFEVNEFLYSSRKFLLTRD